MWMTVKTNLVRMEACVVIWMTTTPASALLHMLGSNVSYVSFYMLVIFSWCLVSKRSFNSDCHNIRFRVPFRWPWVLRVWLQIPEYLRYSCLTTVVSQVAISHATGREYKVESMPCYPHHLLWCRLYICIGDGGRRNRRVTDLGFFCTLWHSWAAALGTGACATQQPGNCQRLELGTPRQEPLDWGLSISPLIEAFFFFSNKKK